MLAHLNSVFRNLFRKERIEQDLDDEIRSHLELLTDHKIKEGMNPELAARAARVEIGGIEHVKEEVRAVHAGVWLETLWQDLSFGVRMLRKNPGFTTVAVLTLALGIGANTAIFSVVQGVLLAPLPYRNPDQLVAVWENNLKLKRLTLVSYPDFLDWQRNVRSFQQMAGFDWQGQDLTLPGTPERVDGMEISSGFFSTLGVELALGREFSSEEDRHSGAPVVIISERLWRNRFGGSAETLGKSVTLGGSDFTIVGVVGSGFHFTGNEADVYTPVGQGDPLIFNDRTIHPIWCIARLKPGVTLAQSDSDVGRVQEQLDQTYPDQDRVLGTAVLPLKQFIVGDAGPTLLLLLGAVGLVLIIACVNFASLLLARSAARSHEFAIRLALGAKRARIVRQLVTESVLVSLAGGGLGLAVAKWGVRPVLAAVPNSLPRIDNIGMNTPVLLFAFSLSIIVGILFGLSPALKSSNPQVSLKEGARGSTTTHHRAQSSLVIVQMALALVLLIGAGLLFRTIRHLWSVNPGFDAQHVLTLRVGLSPSATKTGSSVRIAYQQLTERLRQIPGIQAADITCMVPLIPGANTGPFLIGSREPADITEVPRALYYWTGPDYLEAMQIPLLRGRFFTPEDTTKSEPIIVIDSVLANTYFPNKDPVGQTMTIPHWDRGPARVIGVVGHVQHYGLRARGTDIENQIYISLYQLPDKWAVLPFYRELTVAVRTSLATATVMPSIRAAVYAAGSDQTVYEVRTMDEIVSESMASQRLPMILLGAFAGLALLLASVGIYGVVSFSVAERGHEIGIRMALGADRADVFRTVIGQGLRLTLAGVAIGGVAALILTRLLFSFSHLLYGVGTNDPLTFIAVSLVLTAVAILACFVPARRATKVDPMVALRYE